MKQEFLEYLIRECVKEVLEAFPADGNDTVGAPAPPAAGQGTADQPAVPQTGPAATVDTTGVLFFNPKTNKLEKVDIKGQQPADFERELSRKAASVGGPQVRVSSAVLKQVPQVLANPNTRLFTYVGQQNPEDPALYLLPARSEQEARQKGANVNPESQPETPAAEPQSPEAQQPDAQTSAPDIDENHKLKEMLSTMIREALAELNQ